MLRLILSGFITSAESAFTQWRDDLKGREKYEAARWLTRVSLTLGAVVCQGRGHQGEEDALTPVAQTLPKQVAKAVSVADFCMPCLTFEVERKDLGLPSSLGVHEGWEGRCNAALFPCSHLPRCWQ